MNAAHKWTRNICLCTVLRNAKHMANHGSQQQKQPKQDIYVASIGERLSQGTLSVSGLLCLYFKFRKLQETVGRDNK